MIKKISSALFFCSIVTIGFSQNFEKNNTSYMNKNEVITLEKINEIDVEIHKIGGEINSVKLISPEPKLINEMFINYEKVLIDKKSSIYHLKKVKNDLIISFSEDFKPTETKIKNLLSY